MVVGLPSWINFYSVAPSEYKSRVLFSTEWVADDVDMSLMDRR